MRSQMILFLIFCSLTLPVKTLAARDRATLWLRGKVVAQLQKDPNNIQWNAIDFKNPQMELAINSPGFVMKIDQQDWLVIQAP